MSEQNGGSGTALTIRRAANLPAEGWSDERIAAVARTVAPSDAKPAEIAMFLAVAHAYQLDPFLKEIWLAKDKGKIIVLTGRDSFLKVARRDPAYGGYESGLFYSKDDFEVERRGPKVAVHHVMKGFDRGELVGAYCVVHKADHPDVLVMRRLDDYQHLQYKDNWKLYAPDMLETRVITAAHRRAFHISGLYAPEEFVDGEVDPDVDRDSVRAHEGTRQRIHELKARMGGGEEIQEGEYTFEDEPSPEHQAELGREIQAEEEADTPFRDEEKSDYERAKGRYFALWKEHAEPLDIDRAEWQEEHVGKRSAGAFSEADFRRAADMLEHGLGLEAREAEPSAEREEEPAVVQGGLDDDLPF